MSEETKALAAITDADMLSEEQVMRLLIYQDIADLDPRQRAQFLFGLCRKQKLDPTMRPFDLIKTKDGKTVLYANKSCGMQVRERDRMKVVPIYMGPVRQISFDDDGKLTLGDILPNGDQVIITIFKATSEGDDRPVYDLSALAINRNEYQWMEDAIKKMWTQATRRTTLSKGAIAATDESESGSWSEGPAQPKPTAPRRVGPKSEVPVDLPTIPDNVKDSDDPQEASLASVGPTIAVEATVVHPTGGNGVADLGSGPRALPRRGRPAVKPPVEG